MRGWRFGARWGVAPAFVEDGVVLGGGLAGGGGVVDDVVVVVGGGGGLVGGDGGHPGLFSQSLSQLFGEYVSSPAGFQTRSPKHSAVASRGLGGISGTPAVQEALAPAHIVAVG
jgi:hypothetical protein